MHYYYLIADNEPPTVIPPANLAMEFVDPGRPYATVSWSPSPSATDVVDGWIDPLTIRCENNAGSIVTPGGKYSVGLITVTCRVNDTALNEGSSHFNITVIGWYYCHFIIIIIIYSAVPQKIIIQYTSLPISSWLGLTKLYSNTVTRYSAKQNLKFGT